jgi:DnaD/phage-associated family protein
MSSLLIDDNPILVLPKLAEAIGLNEAIFVQQLHFWLNNKKTKERNGKKYVYNSYKMWKDQMPFWSESTIKRTVKSLEESELVVREYFSKGTLNRTSWYTLNYDKLKDVEISIYRKYQSPNSRTGQNDPLEKVKVTERTGQNDQNGEVKMTRTITEITNRDLNRDVVNKPNAFTVFEQSGFGMLSGTIIDNINHWIDDFKGKGSTDQEADELISLAIKKADENGVRKWNYAHKILLNWLNKGFTKPSDVEAHEKQREQSKEKKTEEVKPDLSWEEELDNL